MMMTTIRSMAHNGSSELVFSRDAAAAQIVMNVLRIAAATGGLLGAVLFDRSLAAEEKFRRLSGAQIQSAFAGMELTDEVHWREVYDRNGTQTTYETGRKRVGKWRVRAGQLRTEVGDGGDSGCYGVWLSGRKVELRRDTSDPSPLEGVLEKPTGRQRITTF
jgi:hypothetical protein